MRCWSHGTQRPVGREIHRLATLTALQNRASLSPGLNALARSPLAPVRPIARRDSRTHRARAQRARRADAPDESELRARHTLLAPVPSLSRSSTTVFRTPVPHVAHFAHLAPARHARHPRVRVRAAQLTAAYARGPSWCGTWIPSKTETTPWGRTRRAARQLGPPRAAKRHSGQRVSWRCHGHFALGISASRHTRRYGGGIGA